MSQGSDSLGVGIGWVPQQFSSGGNLSQSDGGFSGAVVLARVLEGTEQPGLLSAGANGGMGERVIGGGGVSRRLTSLEVGYRNLSPQQQDQIKNRWGSHLNEIFSLSRETDAELFHEALFHLGQRLEREGYTEEAGLVYSTLLPNPNSPSTAIPQTIGQQAEERMAVLNGGGSMGHQMEHMGRGFARQALDPGLLLGATGMGLFGKGVELIGMRYLAGANFFRSASGIARTTLEFAPRATGFALEATAFPFAINGANELLGRSVSWAHMDHRILGSWFFLGGMRVGGGFGRMASQRFGIPGLQPLGSIAGVGLGHGGEVLADLREWHGFSNFAVETFGTWANLQVAGRFSEYVFDGQISRMQRVMDLSIESRRREGETERGRFKEWVDSISETFSNFGGPTPLAASAGGGRFPSPSLRLAVSPPRSPNPLEENRSYSIAASGGGEGPPSSGSGGSDFSAGGSLSASARPQAPEVFVRRSSDQPNEPHKTDPRETLAVFSAGSENIYGDDASLFDRAVGNPRWIARVGKFNGHLTYLGDGQYAAARTFPEHGIEAGQRLSLEQIEGLLGETVQSESGYQELESTLPIETSFAGKLPKGLRGEEGKIEEHMLKAMGFTKKQVEGMSFGNSYNMIARADQFTLQQIYALYRAAVKLGARSDEIVGHDSETMGLSFAPGFVGVSSVIRWILASARRKISDGKPGTRTDPPTLGSWPAATFSPNAQAVIGALLGPKGEGRALGPNPVNQGNCATGYTAFIQAANMFRTPWPGQKPIEFAFFGSTEAPHGIPESRANATGFNALRAMVTDDRIAKVLAHYPTLQAAWREAYASLTTELVGFKPAEGAGAGSLGLVARGFELGLPMRARVAGYAMKGDQGNKKNSQEMGEGAEAALRETLRMGWEWQGLHPDTLQYLIGHFPGTAENGREEPLMLGRVLSPEARVDLLSLATLIGHSLGAKGSIEISFLMSILENQLAPGAFNVEGRELHPEVKALEPRARVVPGLIRGVFNYVAGESQGFDGINAAASFGAITDQVFSEQMGYSNRQIRVYRSLESERLGQAREWEEAILKGEKTIAQFYNWFGLGATPTPRKSYHFLSLPEHFAKQEGIDLGEPQGSAPPRPGDPITEGPGLAKTRGLPEDGLIPPPIPESATVVISEVPPPDSASTAPLESPSAGAGRSLDEAIADFVRQNFPGSEPPSPGPIPVTTEPAPPPTPRLGTPDTQAPEAKRLDVSQVLPLGSPVVEILEGQRATEATSPVAGEAATVTVPPARDTLPSRADGETESVPLEEAPTMRGPEILVRRPIPGDPMKRLVLLGDGFGVDAAGSSRTRRRVIMHDKDAVAHMAEDAGLVRAVRRDVNGDIVWVAPGGALHGRTISVEEIENLYGQMLRDQAFIRALNKSPVRGKVRDLAQELLLDKIRSLPVLSEERNRLVEQLEELQRHPVDSLVANYAGQVPDYMANLLGEMGLIAERVKGTRLDGAQFELTISKLSRQAQLFLFSLFNTWLQLRGTRPELYPHARRIGHAYGGAYEDWALIEGALRHFNEGGSFSSLRSPHAHLLGDAPIGAAVAMTGPFFHQKMGEAALRGIVPEEMDPDVGPNVLGYTVRTMKACASGVDAIATGALKMVVPLEGQFVPHLMHVGSSDALHPAWIALFGTEASVSAATLAKYGLTPREASRALTDGPFNVTVGEGGASINMTHLIEAIRRRQLIGADLLGWGTNGSEGGGAHLMGVDSGGLVAAILEAGNTGIKNYGVDLSSGQLVIKGHFTGTKTNNIGEPLALKRALQAYERKYGWKIPTPILSSLMFIKGHDQGNSGFGNILDAVAILREQRIPPLGNYSHDHRDPRYLSNGIAEFFEFPDQPQSRDVKYVFSTSAGFNMGNAAILLGRFDVEDLRRMEWPDRETRMLVEAYIEAYPDIVREYQEDQMRFRRDPSRQLVDVVLENAYPNPAVP